MSAAFRVFNNPPGGGAPAGVAEAPVPVIIMTLVPGTPVLVPAAVVAAAAAAAVVAAAVLAAGGVEGLHDLIRDHHNLSISTLPFSHHNYDEWFCKVDI